MSHLSDFTDIETLKQYVRDDSDTLDDDAIYSLAVTAATEAIQTASNRLFDIATGTPSARYFQPTRKIHAHYYTVPIDDLFDTTNIVMKVDSTQDNSYATTVTATYRLLPQNAPSKGLPYTEIEFLTSYPSPFFFGLNFPYYMESLQVTANWGWSAIPATVQAATLLQASRYLKRRDSPYGVVGSPEMGTQMRLLSKLDPDVQLMINSFKRYWGAV